MRYFLALLFFLLCPTAFAQSESEGYSAAPELDLDRSWLDPGVAIDVTSYNAKTGLYEVVKTYDPTILKIYTSPENLAAAINIINLPALKENPAAIVGHEYDLDHELILVEENDPKQKSDTLATHH